MSAGTYRQCVLRRQNAVLVSYIPAAFAKVGEVLRLKRRGRWQNGWRVEQVGSITIEACAIPAMQSDHKRQRKASDLPKGTFKRG